MAKKIHNAIARIWKATELAQTIAEARSLGYIIKQSDDLTEITTPVTHEVVLRSIYNGEGLEIVRLNKEYFEG